MEATVIIVGAGPAGLATAACLSRHGISSTILEREDCCASLWQRRAYDRLSLHLAKEFCVLPHLPFPPATPTFVPKSQFIAYLARYVAEFNLKPLFGMHVVSAAFDCGADSWVVVARDGRSGELREFRAAFLVAATGENSVPMIPDIAGLETFSGEVIHSSEYKSAGKYADKSVLVVGSGNSGMEIAYDLWDSGARAAIGVRSPFHVVTKEMIHVGMVLLKFLPLCLVDQLVLIASKFKFGDLSKYKIFRPTEGPFLLKAKTGRSPVLDVGTIKKIKNGDIQVVPAISEVKGYKVKFTDGKAQEFDAIIFATGYKSTANNWLKDDAHMLNEKGFPAKDFPNHWKGKHGVYCAGLSRRGLAGCSMDARNIADDINSLLKANGKAHND